MTDMNNVTPINAAAEAKAVDRMVQETVAKTTAKKDTSGSKGGAKTASRRSGPTLAQIEKTAGRAMKAPEVKAKRSSRVAGIQDQVVAALKRGSKTVAEMAASFKVPERDIRLAIDRARSKGEAIKRLKKNTFGYEAAKGAAKPKAA